MTVKTINATFIEHWAESNIELKCIVLVDFLKIGDLESHDLNKDMTILQSRSFRKKTQK